MKIAINGEIIDTELIWKIGPVKNQRLYFDFIIYFFNKEIFHIMSEHTYISKSVDFKSEIEIKAIEDKITQVHDNIIELWNNNKSQIPQFNTL